MSRLRLSEVEVGDVLIDTESDDQVRVAAKSSVGITLDRGYLLDNEVATPKAKLLPAYLVKP